MLTNESRLSYCWCGAVGEEFEYYEKRREAGTRFAL